MTIFSKTFNPRLPTPTDRKNRHLRMLQVAVLWLHINLSCHANQSYHPVLPVVHCRTGANARNYNNYV